MAMISPAERFRPNDAQELYIDVKKILLATDGSKSAINATKYAVGIARLFKAKVRGIFVDTGGETLTAADISPDGYINDGGNGSLGPRGLVIARVYATKHGVTFEEMIARGSVVKRIIESAQEFVPDLIIMGNSEKHGLKRSLGSCVDAVMNGTDIPVLVVRGS